MHEGEQSVADTKEGASSKSIKIQAIKEIASLYAGYLNELIKNEDCSQVIVSDQSCANEAEELSVAVSDKVSKMLNVVGIELDEKTMCAVRDVIRQEASVIIPKNAEHKVLWGKTLAKAAPLLIGLSISLGTIWISDFD